MHVRNELRRILHPLRVYGQVRQALELLDRVEVAQKQALYGYQFGLDGGALEENPHEQRAIELIRELQASGMTLRRIHEEIAKPAESSDEKTPIWDLVITDMKARDRVGRERYGRPLHANNGRDALMDAYEEALDLAVYLRQAIEER
jgi:hypothetical protein